MKFLLLLLLACMLLATAMAGPRDPIDALNPESIHKRAAAAAGKAADAAHGAHKRAAAAGAAGAPKGPHKREAFSGGRAG